MSSQRKKGVHRPEGVPYLEVQVHPSDIRRKVRYFFLTARQVRGGLISVGAFLGFLLLNLILLPGVLTDIFSRNEFHALVSERTRQGDRLRELTGRLEALGGRSEGLHLRMSRIFLAYGLEADETGGQGGYPFGEGDVPDSIYAGVIRETARAEAQITEQLRVLETFIDEVQTFENSHGGQVRTTPSTSPLKSSSFVLTSPFGNRRNPFTKKQGFHAGVDMAANTGTPIYAPADGVVVFAGRYPLKQSVSWWRYGNMVALRNGDRFITLFGHCDEVQVRSGQRVKQGDVIATVGNTGWSTSPHLHYEVRHRSDDEQQYRPVDPRIYILDHRWRDEEQLLVRARTAPAAQNFEPLPRIIAR